MKKIPAILIIAITVASLLTISVFAAEADTGIHSESNVFDEIYAVIIAHSDAILSALAFAASLLIAFSYRKGVIPLLKGGLNTLGGAVTRLGEENKKANELSERAIAAATEKLLSAEECIVKLEKRLESLEDELSRSFDGQTAINDMKLIMEAETDLLYEIFMYSSLPVYQKEAVGEKIALMKKSLSKYEEKTDE